MFISCVLSEFEINEIRLYSLVNNVYFMCLFRVRDKWDRLYLLVNNVYFTLSYPSSR